MQTSSKKSFITSNIGTIFLSLSISFFLSSWTDFSLFYRWLRRVAIPRIRWPLKNLFHIILHFRQRTVASRDSLFPSTNAVKLRDYNFKVRSHIYFSKKTLGLSRPLSSLFSSFQQSFLIQLIETKFADGWIRIADLWCLKQPLYQLSHSHCPKTTFLTLYTHYWTTQNTVVSDHIKAIQFYSPRYVCHPCA